jgi:low temperature requirement protein LtrA
MDLYYIRRRIKREIFPLLIILSSFVLNYIHFNQMRSLIVVPVGIIDEIYYLYPKKEIYCFSFMIAGSYLLFLVLDILYEALAIKELVSYLQELYRMFNILLLIILGFQFSVIQYNLKKVEYIGTYFFPVVSISCFILVILFLRMVLKSGSRNYPKLRRQIKK